VKPDAVHKEMDRIAMTYMTIDHMAKSLEKDDNVDAATFRMTSR
jgi:hypothetical protein